MKHLPLRRALPLLALLGALAPAVGCANDDDERDSDSNDGPVEETGEQIDQAVDQARDATESALETAGDAVEQAGDEVEDAVDGE